MRAYSKSIVLLACLLGALAPWSGAGARERILSFRSDIVVRTSGAMQVRETIQVNAEGRQIRHGIYRDFPTEYRDRAGNRYHVDFEVVRVLRDGQSEDYHTKQLANGVRVYIGSRNRTVSRGEHTYTLIYDTDRQLGFFKNHDELYWNVTGNGWDFPIDHASADIALPTAVPASAIHVEGYTGQRGAKGQHYHAALRTDGTAHIETTRPLGPHAGLTVVVTWPKGYVHQPTAREQAARILADNAYLAVALAGLLLVLAYYYLVWRAVGKDPAAGVIIPLYEPPAGYSPASMRFISRMGYDDKTFAAAVVNLAVKGLLRIEEDDDVYTLSRTERPADNGGAELAPGEGALMKKLFAAGDAVVLKKESHKRVSEAISAHKKSLKDDYEKKFFFTNKVWVVPGVALSILALVISVLLGPAQKDPGSLIVLVWLGGWTIAVVGLTQKTVSAWRAVGHGGSGVLTAIFTTAFALPFFGGELFGIGALAHFSSTTMVAVVLATVAVNWLFFQWLKRPTRAGRKLLDQIEGFRLYLDVAEGEELKRADPLEKTPALFEAYLP